MKIYVWGTGCGAGDLIDRGLDPGAVCAFLDGEGRGGSFLGRPVIPPEALLGQDFDLILVASRQAEAIAAKAEELGFPREKLLFLKNNWTLRDRNLSYEAAARVLPPALLEELRRPELPMQEPLWLERSPLTARDLENDCVRLRSLEAICRRLGDVPGDAAELGVYRGAWWRPTGARTRKGSSPCCLTRSGQRSARASSPARRRAWRRCALPWSPWTRTWRKVPCRACTGSGRGSPREAPCCCMTGEIPGCRGWREAWRVTSRSWAVPCPPCPFATAAAPWC